MKAGDMVKFRSGSKAWKSRGFAAESQRMVVDLYRAAVRGLLKVDVCFGSAGEIERGIDIEELERVPAPSPPTNRTQVECARLKRTSNRPQTLLGRGRSPTPRLRDPPPCQCEVRHLSRAI
jgi:hypothetical protein